MMSFNAFADLYERDIRKLIEEIRLFQNEDNLWRTQGSVKNSCGNLALHIIGGMNYLIGSTLAQTGFVRHRDREFLMKDVKREVIMAQLEELSSMINTTLKGLTREKMEQEYPMFFDKPGATIGYVLLQLLLHLNYHLGQVNYLRRMLEDNHA